MKPHRQSARTNNACEMHKKAIEEEGNEGSQGNDAKKPNCERGRLCKNSNEDTSEDHLTSLCNFDIEI